MKTDIVIGLGINPEISAQYVPGPEQKLPADIAMEIAGTSVNGALNLRQCGHSVRLIGAIGHDCHYQGFLTKILEDQGVDHVLLPIKEKTSVAVVLLPKDGQAQVLSDKPGYFAWPHTQIREAVSSCHPKYIVATGVVPEEIELIEDMFLGFGKAVKVFNPRQSLIAEKVEFQQLLAMTDILAVNQEEFCCHTGNGKVTFEDMVAIHRFGPKIVLVTRDAQGAMLSTKDGIQIDQPAIDHGGSANEVGAGDCFLAYFIHALSTGMTFEEAMALAALAAGIKVTKVGGSNVPTKEEVEAALTA